MLLLLLISAILLMEQHIIAARYQSQDGIKDLIRLLLMQMGLMDISLHGKLQVVLMAQQLRQTNKQNIQLFILQVIMFQHYLQESFLQALLLVRNGFYQVQEK